MDRPRAHAPSPRLNTRSPSTARPKPSSTDISPATKRQLSMAPDIRCRVVGPELRCLRGFSKRSVRSSDHQLATDVVPLCQLRRRRFRARGRRFRRSACSELGKRCRSRQARTASWPTVGQLTSGQCAVAPIAALRRSRRRSGDSCFSPGACCRTVSQLAISPPCRPPQRRTARREATPHCLPHRREQVSERRQIRSRNAYAR